MEQHTLWNPWHGCKRISEGCLNCYVYRIDTKNGNDPTAVKRNATFDLPLKRKKDGAYLIPHGHHLYTCLSSDFFLDDADKWRPEAWNIISRRPDVHFHIITKRPERFYIGLPSDWGDGYRNVSVGCTCENQRRTSERLPVFLNLPIRHKFIICEPLLEEIDLGSYILGQAIDFVSVGGESGDNARTCNYDWVLKIAHDCKAADIPFKFKQTGANFVKDGIPYRIDRKMQMTQARKAGIDTKQTDFH